MEGRALKKDNGTKRLKKEEKKKRGEEGEREPEEKLINYMPKFNPPPCPPLLQKLSIFQLLSSRQLPDSAQQQDESFGGLFFGGVFFAFSLSSSGTLLHN